MRGTFILSSDICFGVPNEGKSSGGSDDPSSYQLIFHMNPQRMSSSDGAPAKSVALLVSLTHLAAFSLMFVLLAFTAHARSTPHFGIVEDPQCWPFPAQVVVTNVETGATRTLLAIIRQLQHSLAAQDPMSESGEA